MLPIRQALSAHVPFSLRFLPLWAQVLLLHTCRLSLCWYCVTVYPYTCRFAIVSYRVFIGCISGQSAWTSQVVPGHWCFLCDLERQRCQGHSLGFLQHFRLRQCWGTARIRAPIPIFLLQSSQKCLKSLGKHAEKTLETTCAASSSSTSSPDKSCKVHVTMDKRQGTFKAF